jgi:hypothetical protein
MLIFISLFKLSLVLTPYDIYSRLLICYYFRNCDYARGYS